MNKDCLATDFRTPCAFVLCCTIRSHFRLKSFFSTENLPVTAKHDAMIERKNGNFKSTMYIIAENNNCSEAGIVNLDM